MHSTVHSPKPVRSLKRSLNHIDSACNNPSKRKKLRRLSSLPLPLPSPDSSENAFFHPSNHHSEAPSRPACKRKRVFEDPRPCDAPPKKQRWSQPLPSPLSSTVYQWLSQLPRPERTPFPRPESAPPRLLSTETQNSFIEPRELTSATLARIGMLQANRQQPGSTASSQNTKPGTSDPLYRSLIYRNNITLDLSGREIEDEIQELLDVHILKGRDSPPLTDAEVFEVVDKAVELMDVAEGRASDIIRTKAFPMDRRHISEGRNVQWTTNALPSNPEYPHQLTAPKPDRHYGYPLLRMSEWTDKEMAVVDHRTAQPYAQPTRENIFPFLMLEVKSEATGGVLYAAENQAVGSGVHSVSSLRWLLEEASPAEAHKTTDAVAFTVAVSPRAAVFYIVWYSEDKKRYIMSKFSDVSFLNGPKRPDIQNCRNVMKNVLDYGVNVRQVIIRNALADLSPPPLRWKKSRSASSNTETPPTSSVGTRRFVR
ncbi:hypothetical protein MMC07_002658 [Pseudocyphellaria aurata]|nr:hypothetical protein [Pseudocyphellaria aurata]